MREWEDNIKVDRKPVGREYLLRIQLAQDMED
jgi:hypothetical protein